MGGSCLADTPSAGPPGSMPCGLLGSNRRYSSLKTQSTRNEEALNGKGGNHGHTGPNRLKIVLCVFHVLTWDVVNLSAALMLRPTAASSAAFAGHTQQAAGHRELRRLGEAG